jgi:hypothetical protein
MTDWVMHYIRVKNLLFTIWNSWVSKDAEFYVGFKNINLPKWQNAQNAKEHRISLLHRGLTVYTDENLYPGITFFLGAFCHQGKFIFLKST